MMMSYYIAGMQEKKRAQHSRLDTLHRNEGLLYREEMSMSVLFGPREFAVKLSELGLS